MRTLETSAAAHPAEPPAASGERAAPGSGLRGAPAPMSDLDAILWKEGRDPRLRATTVTSVMLLDRPPDAAGIERALDRAFELLPRLRHRVRDRWPPRKPAWEADSDFSSGYHLRHRRYQNGEVRDVLDTAGEMAMTMFDPLRGLWEVVVLAGLERGAGALVVKRHHAVVDGMGFQRLARMLADDVRGPCAPSGAHSSPRAPDRGAVRGATTGPRLATRLNDLWGDLTDAFRPFVSGPRALSPLMHGRSLNQRFEVLSEPLPCLEHIVRRTGASLNTVFLSALASGLHRYHEILGRPTERLRLSVPVNRRPPHAGAFGGNHFVLAKLEVPVGQARPLDRLRAISALSERELRAFRAANARLTARFFHKLAGGIQSRSPSWLAAHIASNLLRDIDVGTTIVQCALHPLRVAGVRMLASFTFIPPSGAAASVSCVTYAATAHFGVTVDLAAVPEPELFRTCIVAGLNELKEAVS